MSKMFFEVKKYISKKHIFDIMNFFKENKVNFNLNTFKSSKTLKLNIYNTSLFGGLSKQDCNPITNNLSIDDNINGCDDNLKKIEIEMKNTKYQAKIYEYDDGYSKTINFIKINSTFDEKNINFNLSFLVNFLLTSHIKFIILPIILLIRKYDI
jgi:hypothetical protein